MKWYNYVFLICRVLLFWVLYHLAISLVLGMIIGVVMLVQHGGHTHVDDITNSFADNFLMFVIIGTCSLVVAGVLSGWQHFRYYKRKIESNPQPQPSPS